MGRERVNVGRERVNFVFRWEGKGLMLCLNGGGVVKSKYVSFDGSYSSTV